MRKKLLVCILAGCLVLGGCGKSEDTSSTDIDSVELESNQEIVIGEITEIYGNEITYTVAEEQDASSLSDSKSGKGGMPSGSAMPSGSGAPDMSQNSSDSSSSGESTSQEGSTSSSSDSSSNSSDQSMQGQEMPSGSGAPDMGEMPSGSGAPDMSKQDTSSSAQPADGSDKSSNSSSDSSSDDSDQVVYSLTDESDTMTIPVGTSVVTSLGNKTTFSRLSSGDIIKMIIETDDDGNKVIVGIWMV